MRNIKSSLNKSRIKLRRIKMGKFIEQYMRVKRWLARIEEIYKDSRSDKTEFRFEDDVYAFFINCYHLKDWIKNDKDCDIKDVEKFVEKSDKMQICRDLCNGMKHLTNPIVGGNTKTIRHFDWQMTSIKFEIVSDGKSYDALELAKSCMEEWKELIENSGISFTGI